MAGWDKRIQDLPTVTNLQNNDLFLVSDANDTYKVSFSALKKAIGGGGGGGGIIYLDYMQFNGIPIELPILYSANISTYVDFEVITTANWQAPCGTHDTQATGNITWNRIAVENNGTLYFGSGTRYGQNPVSATARARHLAEFDAALHEIRLDGIKVLDYNPVDPGFDMKLTVGGHYFTNIQSPFTGKIYRYKAINATTGDVIIDLKPAKLTYGNADISGLYDEVGGEMYPVPIEPW